jgi:hypothetical protein
VRLPTWSSHHKSQTQNMTTCGGGVPPLQLWKNRLFVDTQSSAQFCRKCVYTTNIEHASGTTMCFFVALWGEPPLLCRRSSAHTHTLACIPTSYKDHVNPQVKLLQTNFDSSFTSSEPSCHFSKKNFFLRQSKNKNVFPSPSDSAELPSPLDGC